jgi:sugar/nucleoside kinase (ribokinase family)
MGIAVLGNVTLDVICRTVDDVPRYESIAFDQVTISPGGCGSNVAVGLGNLKVKPILICRVGEDEAAKILRGTWKKYGIDLRFVETANQRTTAVSVGLVDHDAQPRFIHTPGANATLASTDLNVALLVSEKVDILHVAGFFVLPGLLDGQLPGKLSDARRAGIKTTLDVVYSPRFWDPEKLWPCLPEIDIFFCNQKEAFRLTGEDRTELAIKRLRDYGANTIVVKLGAGGCYLSSADYSGVILAPEVDVIDTTGAGDAFAAGFLASLHDGEDLMTACERGNQAGARMVTRLGAIGGWEEK